MLRDSSRGEHELWAAQKEDASWGTRPLPHHRFCACQNRLRVQLNDAKPSFAVVVRSSRKEQLIDIAIGR